ncbi:MAG: HPP family protein [Solirubrobacteraceae bacterium]|nr:HPP family protein [Solirubrobacteraceae bacterium]
MIVKLRLVIALSRPSAHAARLAAGVLGALLGLVALGALTHASLLIAPFAATAALGHASPHARGARPRNVIGGYAIGAAIGLAVGMLAPGDAVGAAVAAAFSASLMGQLDLEHPPAVAMTVLAVQQPVPWVLGVAAAGAVAVTASTVVLAPLLHRRAYPAGLPARARRLRQPA